jgi:hypothetical protein
MINEWKVFDYGVEVQAKMDFATTTLMRYSDRREQRRMTFKPSPETFVQRYGVTSQAALPSSPRLHET